MTGELGAAAKGGAHRRPIEPFKTQRERETRDEGAAIQVGEMSSASCGSTNVTFSNVAFSAHFQIKGSVVEQCTSSEWSGVLAAVPELNSD